LLIPAALDFTSSIARVHAEISADLQSKGQPIGAHDLIIAATAQEGNLLEGVIA
jgi:predicted nucleic acid-binding protein